MNIQRAGNEVGALQNNALNNQNQQVDRNAQPAGQQQATQRAPINPIDTYTPAQTTRPQTEPRTDEALMEGQNPEPIVANEPQNDMNQEPAQQTAAPTENAGAAEAPAAAENTEQDVAADRNVQNRQEQNQVQQRQQQAVERFARQNEPNRNRAVDMIA